MPQMAPLSWLLLMITFIAILISFNIMNYYSFSKNLDTQKQKTLKKTDINWKW